VPLSTISITEGDGGRRLATAEITQGGETVSLTRVVVENFADAAPDTFAVVVSPVPAGAIGALAVVWGANGSDRRICVPKIELQQISAATSNSLVRVSIHPIEVGDITSGGGVGFPAREAGQLLVPQPVDPRGPLTMIAVNENTYDGVATDGFDSWGGLQYPTGAGEFPGFPDDLSSGAIDYDNPSGYTAQRYAVKTMNLSTSAVDFQRVEFDFSQTGKYIAASSVQGIAVQVDSDMNGAQVLIRITMIESEA
jgi:hypothetical protein